MNLVPREIIVHDIYRMRETCTSAATNPFTYHYDLFSGVLINEMGSMQSVRNGYEHRVQAYRVHGKVRISSHPYNATMHPTQAIVVGSRKTSEMVR